MRAKIPGRGSPLTTKIPVKGYPLWPKHQDGVAPLGPKYQGGVTPIRAEIQGRGFSIRAKLRWRGYPSRPQYHGGVILIQIEIEIGRQKDRQEDWQEGGQVIDRKTYRRQVESKQIEKVEREKDRRGALLSIYYPSSYLSIIVTSLSFFPTHPKKWGI